MGKSKFTVDEGKRIINFIQDWRKENPNATEWPLDQIQQSLKMTNYSKDQIRNKIASLQKSEKTKGSTNYKVLCLRQGIPHQKKKRQHNENSQTFLAEKSEILEEKLELVKKMFRTVEPGKAFDGWFQLHIHDKTNLGRTVGDTWGKIAKNWDKIRIGLPQELQEKFMKKYGTADSDLSIVKTNQGKPQAKGSLTLKKRRLVFDSSSDEELIEPNSKCSSNESDSLASPNVSMSVDFQPTDTSITCRNDDLLRTELSPSRVQIPFKYLIANDWTFAPSKELEPSCNIFGQKFEEFPQPETNWPLLIPAILNYPNIWSKITNDDTWKDLINKAKLNCDLISTKMEFFRDVLPKRRDFFEMAKTKMETYLKPNQPEALNLVFYSIFYGRSFSDFQRLYDDGLLDDNVPWHIWIFGLKATLNQTDAKEFFGATDLSESVVKERLYSLIFNDGMKIVYNTVKGKQVLNRLIRTIYATQTQF